jgi:hypothetical protein
MNVQRSNSAGPTGPAGHRQSWPVEALLAVGGWLVVSPLVLSTTLAALAGWASVAPSRIPPLAVASFLGLWLLLAPMLWEFSDGVDSDPGLVPIAPSDVKEPMRAMVARAEWNSILAGLVILLLAGSALLADRRRQGRSATGASADHR